MMSEPTVKAKSDEANSVVIWGYCRVSTVKADGDAALIGQVKWAQKFAAERNAELILFTERAPAQASRPEYSRLLGLLRNGAVQSPQFLIATSLDRITRDTDDFDKIVGILKATGCRLFLRDRGELANF